MTGYKVKQLGVLFTFVTAIVIFGFETTGSPINASNSASVVDSLRASSHLVEQDTAIYAHQSTAGVMSAAAYLPLIQYPDDYLPPWLTHFNHFRNEANLPHLAENVDWSNGGMLHARYMVKNDTISHSESASNPWYTPEGNAAAGNGNVFVSSWTGTTDEAAIGFWIAGPFHAISMLDPRLHTTGFGSYREADGGWQMGATLDVLRGRGSLPQGTTYPLPFPRDAGQAWVLRYNGGEWPNPLTSCPNYSTPTGPPIMLQLGSGNVTPNVTAHQISTGGSVLESCRFDETNYTNPDAGTQSIGRSVLGARDAVVIMPRQPLVAGQTYDVSITANGITTLWSFTAVNSPSSKAPFILGEYQMR